MEERDSRFQMTHTVFQSFPIFQIYIGSMDEGNVAEFILSIL